ncbi:terminase small subunit-like protein [Paraburkholderia bryophila]|uniref:terminase small subunit-like protein n=1 Tax=Paraburkholderia bryophila TaxID=420952 RepID=UPI00359C5F8B
MTSPRRFIPDATIRLILASVSNGQPLLSACESAGVSRGTFYSWLHSGDEQLIRDYAAACAQQVHSRFGRS